MSNTDFWYFNLTGFTLVLTDSLIYGSIPQILSSKTDVQPKMIPTKYYQGHMKHLVMLFLVHHYIFTILRFHPKTKMGVHKNFHKTKEEEEKNRWTFTAAHQ
jgi:hypothetical protein